MFRRLSSTPTDLFTISIPVLRKPPEKRIDIEEPHRPFDGERVYNIIAGHTSSIYVDFLKSIGWNNISISSFPSNLRYLPAVVFINSEQKGIVLNIDLCGAYFDVDKKRIIVNDYNDFSTCILYGLNKLIIYDIEDESVLNSYYYAMTIFAYSLLMRTYGRDFDVFHMTDQELGSIFYLIGKLICSQYFEFNGNTKAIALGAVNKFFTKDEKRIKFRIDTRSLPDEDIESWSDLFVVLTQYDIMSGITLEEFRSRATRLCGMTGVIGISSGMELISMLNSVPISSNVFHRNLKSINPSAVNIIIKATHDYIRDNIKPEEKEEDEFFLDRWGEE